MQKFLKIAGIILVVIFIFLLWVLRKVDYTPYFNKDYYKNTRSRLDSVGKELSLAKGSLQVGFGKQSITPGLGAQEDNAKTGTFKSVPMAGFGSRRGRPAEGIHDSIFVKATALKVQGKLLILVGADMLIIPPVISEDVCSQLNKKLGLKRDQLFFSATHTHSGVGAWANGLIGESFAGKPNPEVIKWLIQQFRTAIEDAIKDLQPGEIGNRSFKTGNLLWNRMVWDKGEKNSVFTFILARQDSGKKVILGSFDAHPTTLGDWNMEISGDYPGYWQRKLENNGYDMAVFFAGSVGNQGPRRKREKFGTPQYLGETLADSVLKYSKFIKLSDSITLSYMNLQIDLPEFQIRVTDGLRLKQSLAEKLMKNMGDINFQAARIGKLIWLTSPGDFSGELAIQLKNEGCNKGYNVLVTGFNGAYLGYILPGRYYHYNNYESRTMSWFGPYMGPYSYEMMHRMMQIITSL